MSMSGAREWLKCQSEYKGIAGMFHARRKETAGKKGVTRFKTRKGFSKCQEHQLISLGLFPLFLTLWLDTKGMVVSATATENGSEKISCGQISKKCQ